MELGRRPGRVALVTCTAIGGGRDVIGRLARSVAAVMAAGAIGGASEGAVVGLGAGPGGVGLVAALATRGRGQV